MAWNLEEALSYYRSQGAPSNQTILVNLLKEIQQETGGGIPRQMLSAVAQAYGMKEVLLLSLVRRIPTLRLQDTHCLEICGGEGCARRARLCAFMEKTYGTTPKAFTWKAVGCMRQCGKGPNIRWDGVFYHEADEKLIRRLVEKT